MCIYLLCLSVMSCYMCSEVGGRTQYRLLCKDAGGDTEQTMLHETVPTWVVDVTVSVLTTLSLSMFQPSAYTSPSFQFMYNYLASFLLSTGRGVTLI